MWRRRVCRLATFGPASLSLASSPNRVAAPSSSWRFHFVITVSRRQRLCACWNRHQRPRSPAADADERWRQQVEQSLGAAEVAQSRTAKARRRTPREYPAQSEGPRPAAYGCITPHRKHGLNDQPRHDEQRSHHAEDVPLDYRQNGRTPAKKSRRERNPRKRWRPKPRREQTSAPLQSAEKQESSAHRYHNQRQQPHHNGHRARCHPGHLIQTERHPIRAERETDAELSFRECRDGHAEDGAASRTNAPRTRRLS